MSLRNFKNISARREFLEKKLKISLSNIGIFPLELEKAQKGNCENMIGVTSIPLGVAGPLLIKENNKAKEYYVPLATTEAALVASVNRGCKATALCGGISVELERIGMSRAPVFQTQNLTASFAFTKWLEDNIDKLRQEAMKTSSHLYLKDYLTQIIGNHVFARFIFDTGEAMGMNMATIAVARMVKYIEKEAKVKCPAVASNFDSDKKPSWINFLYGRGRKVWAQAQISQEAALKILKTDIKSIHEVAQTKCLLGSAISGSGGFNCHFANCIAAIFVACGQDVAHVVEGSLGVTSTELKQDKLYLSVYVPSLPIGVIGGGTSLPAQKEALDVLGINPGESGSGSDEFAKVIAGAVLSAELSLLASLAAGTLASSHQTLRSRV